MYMIVKDKKILLFTSERTIIVTDKTQFKDCYMSLENRKWDDLNANVFIVKVALFIVFLPNYQCTW